MNTQEAQSTLSGKGGPVRFSDFFGFFHSQAVFTIFFTLKLRCPNDPIHPSSEILLLPYGQHKRSPPICTPNCIKLQKAARKLHLNRKKLHEIAPNCAKLR